MAVSVLFSNKNAVTEKIFSFHNLAMDTTECYNLQDDMNICENCKRKEIHMIFNCEDYEKFEGKN